MRALLVLVVAMGVLIVVGVAVVAATIVHRMGTAAGLHVAAILLDEPSGTHIIGASGVGDRLAVVLQGGGPDRVAILNMADGHIMETIRLTH